MLAKTHTLGLIGLDAYPVEIEVDVANGLPGTTIVGLPDSSVKESKERVRAGIKNSGFRYPFEKITVSLAPADVKKEGASFDLPIAMGILAASEQIAPSLLDKYYFSGELALDGKLRAIHGVLSLTEYLRNQKTKKLIIPHSNILEASIAENVEVYAFKTLRELVESLINPETLDIHKPSREELHLPPLATETDFSDIKGQYLAKRAMEIAAAGGHNILLVGPPGSGKTMLARRLPGLLPDMTPREALETTKIHSIGGYTVAGSGLIRRRPFRAPHHTISDIALAGGGSNPQPGEISLAHNGILFLDELPEFKRAALEILRQPLEEGAIRIARAQKSLTFPARFMLVAAMNPCPCGFYTDPKKNCRCTQHKIHQYLGRISGPLLDRIDLHVEVPAIRYQDLACATTPENTETIRSRILEARKKQKERFAGQTPLVNAAMNHKQIKAFCPLRESAHRLFKKAMDELGLSMRAHDKILRLSRTIADLENQEMIQDHHVAEAVGYRSLDRNWW